MRKINARYTFQQFNAEINELYNYLKTEKYKDEEIKKVFSPLTGKVRRYSTTTYVVVSLTLCSLLIYLLTYSETFYWHISAIGRIAMIKTLPLFDWTYLKDKPCLIEKSIPTTENMFLNCDFCENLNNIHVYQDIEEDILTHNYLELDVPLILTKGLEKWPKNSDFLQEALKDDDFYYAYPCQLSTNIHKGQTTAGKLLEKVTLFDEFYLHFQNCEFEGMRSLRRYTFRPKFLPRKYSPVLYNWLIWNRDYNSTNYKDIDLVEKVAVFGQLLGTSYVMLTPRSCGSVCPAMDIALEAGESLLFTDLWDLKYRPNEVGENIAVILETGN